MDNLIEKKALNAIIDELTETCQVIAPVIQDGIKQFREITENGQINLDDGNCIRSPKEVFLPLSEPVLTFRQTKEGIHVESCANDKQDKVIIGVRPCDARAMNIIDCVFKWDYEDQFYLSQRAGILMIGLTCNKPDRYCFCTSLNLTPMDETGSDILLTDLGDELYYVKTITDKGHSFIKRFNKYFKKASAKDAKRREKLKSDIISKMPEPLSMTDINTWLNKNFDNPLWEKIGLGCIGCGTCTYFCPTCHCFDLVDESGGYRGERRKNWDSCAFKYFTLMAAHQPRTYQWQRFRQRVMHKFKYFIDRFSQIACVGCGRCRALCAAEKDILHILRTIQDQKELCNTELKVTEKGLQK